MCFCDWCYCLLICVPWFFLHLDMPTCWVIFPEAFTMLSASKTSKFGSKASSNLMIMHLDDPCWRLLKRGTTQRIRTSISSKGADARLYLGHSISMYMRKSMSQCGDGMDGIWISLRWSTCAQSSTQFSFRFLMSFRPFVLWPVNSWKWTRAQKTSVDQPFFPVKQATSCQIAAILWGNHPMSLWILFAHLTQELHSPSSTLVRARARLSDNERTWGMFSILQCLPFPAAAVVIRFLWEDRTMKTYDEVNRSKSWSVLVGNRKQDKNCIHPHTS